jgi:uncharacterized lipoprotein YmbA
MRAIFASLLLSFLCGCSHSVSNPNTYFSFSAVKDLSTNLSESTQISVLKVHAVKLSGIADQQAIVQILPDHEVSVAQHHFWAEHPSNMLSKTLQSTLSKQLTDWQVVNSSVPSDDANAIYLMIEVNEFAGHYNAGSLLNGHWYLYKKGETTNQLLAHRAFSLSEELRQDGFASLVQALERSWYGVASQITKQLEIISNHTNSLN